MGMNEDVRYPLLGGCTCRRVRYRLLMQPMIVHCCHCSWCQRETGSAFVVNALVEANQVQLDQGGLETVDTPSSSGRGQKIVRCQTCKIAVWSHYSPGRAVKFLRVGTLDDPGACAPDIHIFTSTRQRWFELPQGVPAVQEYYRRIDYWSADAIERFNRAVGE